MPSEPFPCSLRKMEERELWWVAGLLEGEGCFTASFIRGWYRLFIQANNTDLSVCEALQNITGVGTVGTFRQQRDNWSKLYYWRVQRQNDADALMRELYPLMSEKRKTQMQVAWEKCNG